MKTTTQKDKEIIIGYYKTRDNRVVHIDSMHQSNSLYPCHGILIMPGKTVSNPTGWSMTGRYNYTATSSLDLVEYLDPKMYPELYI